MAIGVAPDAFQYVRAAVRGRGYRDSRAPIESRIPGRRHPRRELGDPDALVIWFFTDGYHKFGSSRCGTARCQPNPANSGPKRAFNADAWNERRRVGQEWRGW